MSRWEAEGRLADVRTDLARFESYREHPEVTVLPMGAYMFGRTHLARVKGLAPSIPCDEHGMVGGPNPRHVTEVARSMYDERIAALRARETALLSLVDTLTDHLPTPAKRVKVSA